MPYRASEKTRQNLARKRTRLLAAASSLVAERGFSGATVTAIATRGGTSVGTVYSYFSNRDALLVEVFRRAAEYELALVRAAVMAEPGVAGRIGVLVETFARRALNARTRSWALLFEPVSPSVEEQRLTFRQEYVALMEDVLREGVASGEFVRQDPAISASAIIGVVSESLVGRLNPSVAGSPAAVPDDVVIAEIRALCLRAVGHQGGPDDRPPR